MPEKIVGPVGLRSRQVCDLLRLPSSTLNYWIQIGLVHPSLRKPQGRRVEQVWSVRDVVIVRAVQQLRRDGASLQAVRKAREALEAWDESMNKVRLFWDGSDVLVVDESGVAVSTVKQPGQQSWLLGVLPLGIWEKQAAKKAVPVDIEEYRLRDEVRTKRQKNVAANERLLPRRRRQA